MRISVIIIAVLIGGWFAMDGTRALTRGDYFTRGGELGPWSRVVSSVGIDPRGFGMKATHVALGLLWLGAAILFSTRASIGWHLLAGCSVLSLWYLPLGTVLSIVELALLCLPALRQTS